MGLCKCPRKKVTNLFCFEHRVNVCEHCLTENHKKCIVQSYLTWLQDSDYDSNCLLCGKTLNNDAVETVRLLCLHLYHWPCLDAWARQFPAHTAPAGYTCPIAGCREAIFPKANQVSPIVDGLKEKLCTANWARAGLGLPMMPEYDAPLKSLPHLLNNLHSDKLNGSTLVPMDADASLDDDFSSHSRKSFSGVQDEQQSLLAHRNVDVDNEDNKYKRRSAFEWLRRWLKSKSLLGTKRVAKPWTCKRVFFYMLLFVIAVMTLTTVLSRLGKWRSEDPFLDPMANPNIHVADQNLVDSAI